MWVVDVIGGASAFVESTLAQIYKKKDSKGDSYGGPAYDIKNGLNNFPLAIIFSIAIIVCYAIGFNKLALYNIQSSFANYGFYDSKLSLMIIRLCLASVTGIVILSEGKRIIAMMEKVVSFMRALYVILALRNRLGWIQVRWITGNSIQTLNELSRSRFFIV